MCQGEAPTRALAHVRGAHRGLTRGQTPTVARRHCANSGQRGAHRRPGRARPRTPPVRAGTRPWHDPGVTLPNRPPDAALPGATPPSPPSPLSPPGPAAWAIALAGALTLAVAMGIGRFAFTPLLPLMMRDGLIDAAGGAELAAANYLGYLVGALTAGRLATRPLRLVGACLPGIALLTAAAGLLHGLPVWALLRFGAGVCSAWALVGISSWALTALALRGRGALGAVVFTGVGGGITLAGLMAWWAAGLSARALWLLLAAAALLLAAVVALLLRRAAPPLPAAGAARPPAAALPPGSWPLVVCYGSFGFGYILPATFLPAMARALLDDPARFGLVWPVFGAAAMASTLLSMRWMAAWRPLRAWSGCQFAMAAGAALPLVSRSGWAIALAALLVGGTFMLATLIAMQQARAMAPLQPAPLLGRMTAAFALGQIAGPLAVRLLAGVQWQPPWAAGAGGAADAAGAWGAIELTSALATALLLATATWLWRRTPANGGAG